MSLRLDRLAKLLQQEIARILREDLSDPRIGFVSVTHVEVAADYRSARVFVSLLDPDKESKGVLSALQGARGRIQAELGRTLKLRYTPTITFHLDRGIEKSMRISKILEDLNAGKEEPDVGPSP
jgi:ribosome-binding factor A